MDLSFPIVCKPSLGVGNTGVKFINNQKELDNYIKSLKNLHGDVPLKNIFCEEFYIGQSYQLDGVSWNGETRVSEIYSLTYRHTKAGDFIQDSLILLKD